MAQLVNDCPRCKSKQITFDILQTNPLGADSDHKQVHETFCVCRNCNRSVVFVVQQKSSESEDVLRNHLNFPNSVNSRYHLRGFVNIKDFAKCSPPEFLPGNIAAAFTEGATCKSVGCNNAAGTMFRLCLDLATQSMLRDDNSTFNKKKPGMLKPRLDWLFNENVVPKSLSDLSHCIKDDGNDGAHAGNLTETDTDDLLDFTTILLERLYTEPERIRLAKERRDARRASLKTQ